MACTNCGFIDWANPAPVAAAILRYGKQIVLVRNKREDRRGWGLPGGFVEPGENAEEGVLREVLEETGVKGRVNEVLMTHGVQRTKKSFLLIVFEVQRLDGELKAGDEIAEVKLVSLRDALKLVEGRLDEHILSHWAARRSIRFKPAASRAASTPGTNFRRDQT